MTAQTTHLWYNEVVKVKRVFLFLDIDPSFCNSFDFDKKNEEAGRRIYAIKERGTMNRKPLAQSIRDRILRKYHYLCVYCGSAASQVDHVMPVAWVVDNTDGNLVASCSICNNIAGSQVFDSFFDKQTYILEKRKTDKWQHRIQQELYANSLVPVVRPDPPKPEEAIIKPKKKKRKKRWQPKPVKFLEPKTEPKLIPEPSRKQSKPRRSPRTYYHEEGELARYMRKIIRHGLSFDEMMKEFFPGEDPTIPDAILYPYKKNLRATNRDIYHLYNRTVGRIAEHYQASL